MSDRFPSFAEATVLDRSVQGTESPCMYCGSDEGHWERLYTGDMESFAGWEDWFCCHACRDAGRPCETFHKIIPLDPASPKD